MHDIFTFRFSIMHDCWNVCPEKRPTFSQLRNNLYFLLEQLTMADISYLSLELQN